MDSGRTLALGDICKQDRQIANGRHSELPYIGLEQVESGSGRISMESGPRSGQGEGTSFIFDNRHILYGKLRPYLNKVAVPDFRGRCSTELVPLLPNAEIDREYLAYVLRHESTIKAVMAAVTGARMPRADMGVLLDLKVPVLPLIGQRRIVDILNRAASIRQLHQQAQTKARQITPALFVDMFGDPATNPKGWEMSQLGNEIEGFQGGKNVAAGGEDESANGLRILKVSAVTSGFFDPSESKPAPAEFIPLSTYFVRKGDILISRANTVELVGATALVASEPKGLLLPDKIWRIVWKKNSRLLPGFLLHYLQSQHARRLMSQMATGTSGSMKNIAQAKLVKLPVYVPPLSLQEMFTARVSEVRAIASLCERGSNLTNEISAALQHQVFR
jgi:type I restriction enzyme S subunit